jgi:hypothetical protein
MCDVVKTVYSAETCRQHGKPNLRTAEKQNLCTVLICVISTKYILLKQKGMLDTRHGETCCLCIQGME